MDSCSDAGSQEESQYASLSDEMLAWTEAGFAVEDDPILARVKNWAGRVQQMEQQLAGQKTLDV